MEYSLTNPDAVYAIAKGYTEWKSTDAGSSFTQVMDFRNRLTNPRFTNWYNWTILLCHEQ
ncbi:MAG TPA: hypothetical protein PLJ29_19170 [Leptospiraceae bacterium]|nr:hypothetical protein [Leptospiraceae bacterium]